MASNFNLEKEPARPPKSQLGMKTPPFASESSSLNPSTPATVEHDYMNVRPPKVSPRRPPGLETTSILLPSSQMGRDYINVKSHNKESPTSETPPLSPKNSLTATKMLSTPPRKDHDYINVKGHNTALTESKAPSLLPKKPSSSSNIPKPSKMDPDYKNVKIAPT